MARQEAEPAFHRSSAEFGDTRLKLVLLACWGNQSSGGSPYSYCGSMEQSVCCYVPRGARPVGLLPVLNKSKCGRKGNVAAAVGDRKTDGLADLGEWPWHVSRLLLLSYLRPAPSPFSAARVAPPSAAATGAAAAAAAAVAGASAQFLLQFRHFLLCFCFFFLRFITLFPFFLFFCTMANCRHYRLHTHTHTHTHTHDSYQLMIFDASRKKRVSAQQVKVGARLNRRGCFYSALLFKVLKRLEKRLETLERGTKTKP